MIEKLSFFFMLLIPNKATISKQIIGTKKPILMLKLSAIHPINGGLKAPPATAITRNEEPFLVYAPKSLVPRENLFFSLFSRFYTNNSSQLNLYLSWIII